MNKEGILNKLASMNVDQLDKLKDRKLVELRQILKDYHLAKDSELTLRHEKRKRYLESNSLSKVEQMLRADEELYLLKKKIGALSSLKASIKLEVELINNYFWRAKQ